MPTQTKLKLKSKEDEATALQLFNVIQRFMGDPSVSGEKEVAYATYIILKCIARRPLQDEVLCQLCNQTWLNPNDLNAERGWLLMSLCLSCFSPSEQLYPYLLCYITSHGFEGYRAMCQHKLLRFHGRQSRCYPPSLLEFTASSQQKVMTVEVLLPDGTSQRVLVDSATTAAELGNMVARCAGVPRPSGWTVTGACKGGAGAPV